MFFVIIIYDLISKQINQNKHKYKNKWKRKTSKQVSKKKTKQQKKKLKKSKTTKHYAAKLKTHNLLACVFFIQSPWYYYC